MLPLDDTCPTCGCDCGNTTPGACYLAETETAEEQAKRLASEYRDAGEPIEADGGDDDLAEALRAEGLALIEADGLWWVAGSVEGFRAWQLEGETSEVPVVSDRDLAAAWVADMAGGVR